MSFGFVKNGGLNAEALILFHTELADEIAVRRKRAGHLLSKGRMLAAQILALLEDGLWLDNARAANAAAQMLGEAAGDRLLYPVEANEVFLKVSRDEAASLLAQGFDFYEWGAGRNPLGHQLGSRRRSGRSARRSNRRTVREQNRAGRTSGSVWSSRSSSSPRSGDRPGS